AVGAGDTCTDQVTRSQRLALEAHGAVDVWSVRRAAGQELPGYFGVGSVHDHFGFRAHLSRGPRKGYLLLDGHEPVAPLGLHGLGNLVGESFSRGTRLERIGKYAKALETGLAREGAQLVEFGLGLPGEADDKRCAQGESGDGAAEAGQQLFGFP